MEKASYEECRFEVIEFDGQDVIVTSPGDRALGKEVG